MHKRVFEVYVQAPIESVWEFHSSAKALDILTPPGRKLTPLTDDLDVRNGAIHRMRASQFGIPMIWEALISDVDPPHSFTDTARKSPFKHWRHKHEFIAQTDGTVVRDTLEYELPLGILGEIAGRLFVHRDIDALFKFRHEATKKALEK